MSTELKIPLGLPKDIGIVPKLFTDWGVIGAPKDLVRRAALTGLAINYSQRIRGSAGIGIECSCAKAVAARASTAALNPKCVRIGGWIPGAETKL